MGSGYVGLVAAVCLAELGHDVLCVDNDEDKVAALIAGHTPIHEEHLSELLKRHRNTNIHFTSSLADATQSSKAIFIAVGTPQSDSGDADLSYVESVAAEIARSLGQPCVIIEKSTVPVYTSDWIRRVLLRNGVSDELFDVVSNPEFLREGTAVQDFLHPDRIVVGAESPRAASMLQRIYAPLTSGAYYNQPGSISGMCSQASPPPLLLTSTKSAEIIKHASNAFLALKISFINAVANVCDAADADVGQVARGVGLDRRIGTRFLNPGIGYGGSCFPKDVAAFRSVAESLDVDFSLLKEVERINARQRQHFLSKVRSMLWTLRGKRLAILGLAFKGGTDDVRDSPAMEIVGLLIAEGCRVAAYDPAAMERAQRARPKDDGLVYADSAYAAAEGADALLILTDWQEFGVLDLARLRRSLRYPIVIDGRNLYDPEVMRLAGFTYLSVGRPTVDGTLIPNAYPSLRKEAQPMTTIMDTRAFSNVSR